MNAPAAPFYDALETRDPAQREADLMAALSHQVAHAQVASPAHAQRLQGVDAAAITSRAALAQLPVIRKSELLEAQAAQRGVDPFAGFSACGWRGLGYPHQARRVFQSPGPLYEPQGHEPDTWRMARALFAAGFGLEQPVGVEESGERPHRQSGWPRRIVGIRDALTGQ